MDPSPIKVAAIRRGLTHKQLAHQAGISPRRWYRLIEDLAVPTEEELARVATVTGLALETVRTALTSAGPKETHGGAVTTQQPS